MENQDPRHLLIKVVKILSKLNIPYLVTGGVAVLVWGRPRFTADIDLVVEIKREDLTYEIFIELINKTDYLLKRAVEGLDKKIIADEEKKLNQELKSHWRKNW